MNVDDLLGAIDSAIEDYTVSVDAMRWTSDPAPEPPPTNGWVGGWYEMDGMDSYDQMPDGGIREAHWYIAADGGVVTSMTHRSGDWREWLPAISPPWNDYRYFSIGDSRWDSISYTIWHDLTPVPRISPDALSDPVLTVDDLLHTCDRILSPDLRSAFLDPPAPPAPPPRTDWPDFFSQRGPKRDLRALR